MNLAQAPGVPAAIETGVRGAESVPGCTLQGRPAFDAESKKWVVTVELAIAKASAFVPSTTRWCILLGSDYPAGVIDVYPAKAGGLTATFQHQEWNAEGEKGKPWRRGKLCLDTAFRGERRPTIVRDPHGDSDVRLQWYIQRAVDWLKAAAADRLVTSGEPFELPWRPDSTPAKQPDHRAIFDEAPATFEVWRERLGLSGLITCAGLSELDAVTVLARFDDWDGRPIRAWRGRSVVDVEGAPIGLWWLWPDSVILPPWQSPSTWGELRRIGRRLGVDVDGSLKRFAHLIRGSTRPALLAIGYPVPKRAGEAPDEVHWDVLHFPELRSQTGKPPKGFRSNTFGWWQRDRSTVFANNQPLSYCRAENWGEERLRARGALSIGLTRERILVIGVGALGSMFAELLVRAGAKNVSLCDGDGLFAGNICRHTGTLADVGQRKVNVVAKRLKTISVAVTVSAVCMPFGGTQDEITEMLDAFDTIVDCSASDEVIAALGAAWFSLPRTFASFSMGYQGLRLFSYGQTAHQFSSDDFRERVAPWLQDEASHWAENGELLEGAGCWSPLFPARFDDVVMAAATSVKELESIVLRRSASPRFVVFEQGERAQEFLGFVRDPSKVPS